MAVLFNAQAYTFTHVVGKDFDDMKDENDHQKTYETVYSLLSNISSSYERTFGNELARKLANLQQETETQ
eukprot:gene5262-410_t